MNARTPARTVEVRADGEGLVSHAGAFLLTELADRIGLTAALSEAMAPSRERRSAHDPGRVLRDLCVSIADGGECVADLGVIRGQEALFGHLFAVAEEMARREQVTLSGFRVSINQGPDSGQGIPHIHVHLLGGKPLPALG